MSWPTDWQDKADSRLARLKRRAGRLFFSNQSGNRLTALGRQSVLTRLVAAALSVLHTILYLN